MSISQLKKINEKMPYWMKRPFSRLIRNQLINNREFKDTYQFLCQIESAADEQKKEYQLEKLKSVLQHAYEHTTYYHQLFDDYQFNPKEVKSVEELQRLPVLTKEILKEKLSDLMADDIEDFYLVTTGGSTGEPTKVQMEKKAIYREWAFIYHYWSKFGYDFKLSKLATFRGVDMGAKISEINPLYSEIRLNPFIMSSRNIKRYNEEIKKYGSDFIYGYPSAVYNYCRLSKMAGITVKDRFKAALLISENLYPFQEELIREVLDCPIAIFYGHSERAVFAEKINAGYVFNPMYGITEIGSNSEPIVTGFINGKVPLIRYEVDDKIESNNTGTYEITGHRNADLLFGNDGVQISAAAINFHDDTFDDVSAYQFVQEEEGKCKLYVVPNNEENNLDIARIHTNVQKKLGNTIKCTVEQTGQLQLTKRGKYKMIIQNIENMTGGITSE